MWVASALARSARGSAQALTVSGSNLNLPVQLSQATVALTVGACILGVGLVVLLVSALPGLLRRD
jgi:hypothetical protein